MPYDLINKNNIQSMVREFYTKILKDDMLSQIFIKSLGSDLHGDKWQIHLATLDSFWLTMMSDERSYKGSPYPPHKLIGKLHLEMFERWLELFSTVVNKYYLPDIAQKFYEKAEVMAEYFIKKLDLKSSNDTK
ncbi:MAG: group III truncated hemoglobin [Thiovulaceae bacterium]|nr:group III truncated hemoglobin [Sulfurimonadaceae bacterium]